MSTSANGGLSWGAALDTGDSATGLGGQPLVQPSGQVIVPTADANETQIRSFRSTDGGASWSSTVLVSSVSTHGVAGGLRTGPLPSAEIDHNGKVYVAWQDCRFRASCSSNDIVMSTTTDGTTWSAVTRIPIDPTTSSVEHFIPGLAVDRATSGGTAHLALAYYYYPQASCSSSTCQLDVGSVSSSDGGASWSAPSQLAGPMTLSWLPETSQGRMVGDYISTSFVNGVAQPVFALANSPSGSVFDEAIYTLKTRPNAPTVKTEAASSIGKTTAILNATANPNGGNVSECKLEYGTTTAYGSSAPCTPAPGSGESPVAVSAAVSGLSPSTTYHFRVSATNAGGTSTGEDKTFTTLAPNPPTVTTTAATSVTRTLASLNGTVNPNATTVSDCHFDYGPTEAYGSSAPCSSLPGSGTSPVAVTASLGNLSPSSTYHYRVSATNAGGTSTGADQSFTTLASLPTPHWYKDATKVPLGEKLPLIGWGTLTLESSAGTANCHSAQAGNIENSAGAARKEVVLFAAFECKPVGGSCTGGEQRATPRHLPWQGTLLEEGVEGAEEFREEGSGVEINLECFKGGINTSSQLFKTGPVLAEVGTSTPAWLNGLSATKPSEVLFDLASGHLYAEVEKAAVKGTTKGKLKFAGYQDSAGTPLINLAKP